MKVISDIPTQIAAPNPAELNLAWKKVRSPTIATK